MPIWAAAPSAQSAPGVGLRSLSLIHFAEIGLGHGWIAHPVTLGFALYLKRRGTGPLRGPK